MVGIDGKAIFSKLKILDVSSKHNNQSFSIQLQLEEMKKSYSSSEEKIVLMGNPIRSSPLQVRSRTASTSPSNKRKRSTSLSSSNGSSKKRSRGDGDPSFVDITALLVHPQLNLILTLEVLPQKEAAVRLGISESMLCKRFKECTQRKWPYRYVTLILFIC